MDTRFLPISFFVACRTNLFILPIIFGVSLFNTVLLSAQNEVTDQAVNMIPPSPTAAELGKYGLVDVGLSTGTPNVSIPLHTFTTTNLSLPISLSYNSNGVKVDQVSTWVGLSWSLNAGGVITRFVRDEADDFDGEEFPYPENFGATNPQALEYLKIADNVNHFDSEPDLFAFNFNGNSGKFMFDQTGVVVIMPYQNLKVERTVDQQEGTDVFVITTPDGVTYTFGSPEYTRTYSMGAGCGNSFDYKQTAWYLTRIDHPQGDFIELTYDGFGQYSYAVSVSQTIPKFLSRFGGPSCDPCDYFEEVTCTTMAEVTGGYLKSISSPEFGQIEFLATRNRQDIGDYKLDNIYIKNRSGERVKSFSFNYTYSPTNYPESFLDEYGTHRRMFLSSVNENDFADNAIRNHSFEYNDINALPSRLSFSQDHWGYFNGANNSYFVPYDKFNIRDTLGRRVFDGIGGNRDPDWNATAKGILTKITYPTGGYSSLFYEPNDYLGTQTVNANPIPINVGIQGAGFKFVETAVIDIHNVVEQRVIVRGTASFSNEYNELEDEIDPTHHKALVTITDLTLGVVLVNEGIDLGVSRPFDIQLLKDHKYRFQVAASGEIVYGGIGASYLAETLYTEWASIKTGGIRISRVEATDPVTGRKEETRYSYTPIESPGVSSGITNPAVFYYERNQVRSICPAPEVSEFPPTEFKICNYGKLYSNSLNTLFPFNGNHIYYKHVVVSRGVDQDYGATAHEFIVNFDVPGNLVWGVDDILGAPLNNIGWDNGLEKEVRHYKREGKALVLIRKVENTYKRDERKERVIPGLVVRRRFDPVSDAPVIVYCDDSNRSLLIMRYGCSRHHLHRYEIGSEGRVCKRDNGNHVLLEFYRHPCYNKPDPFVALPQSLEHLDAMEYKNTSYWFYLESTKETSYDELGLNPVVKETNYFYDNPEHALVTRTESSGSDNKLIKSLTKYLGDYDSTVENFDLLADRHIVNIPIKTEQIVNEKLVESKIIKYNELGQPVQLYQYEGQPLITPFTHDESQLLPSPDYKLNATWVYDQSHRLHNFYSNTSPDISYKWTFDNTRVHAKILGARAENVFYMGFEESGTIGNAKTGERFLNNGSYAITTNDFSPLITEGMVMSYWYWENNKWNFSGILPFNRNISAGTRLDEIRVYPQGAHLTTVGYDSRFNTIKSMTDPNNISTYYEYDLLGRLLQIKDEQGNIQTEYRYHYYNND